MFAKAYTIASQFTFPVIISYRTFKGDCGSGIGSFVIINEEGWFVTAYHVLEQFYKLRQALTEYNELVEKRRQIENDTTLKNHERMRQLNTLKIKPEAITHCSIWLGWDTVEPDAVTVVPPIDLAVGKLLNFDKSNVKTYPLFKDATKPMDLATSLCKLGYPFHAVQPVFHEESSSFSLPAGSVPPPFFPLDGIYTRTVQVLIDPPSIIPLKYIETSSPGLRGQSGGPIFDVHGAVWAIQSKTQHLKLGFGNDTAPGKEAEHLRNQYLNVGLGIHAETLTAVFKQKNIPYQETTY